MNFQTAIQLLCQLTQIKVADLAQVINYDRTIVSKWKNGQRLPSRKNYKMILKQWAHCFAQVIVTEQKEEQLKDLCHVQTTLRNKSEVAEAIAGILELAYFQSEIEFETKVALDEDHQSFVISSITAMEADQEQVAEFLKEKFLDRLARKEGDVHMYSTVTLAMLIEDLLSTLKHVAFKKKRKVILNLAVKKSELWGLTKSSFFSFAKLLMTSSNIDIRIYMYQDQDPDEFFYIFDDCVTWVVYTKSGTPSLIYSHSKQLRERLFD